MTADQRDRWAIPSLRPEVVDLSMLQPGTTIYAAAVMLDLADQMSARGWRQEAAGTMRCNRRDGVECRGAWSTWRKVTP